MEVKRSFVELLAVHRMLEETFLCHQETLLSLDIHSASEILARYKPELLTHMKQEEDLLLPLYQARAGKIPGGAVELFLGEHRKMTAFITEFQAALARMRGQGGSQLKRSVISLLDRECMYKSLAEHHNLREKNILYPWLDRITTEPERATIIEKCLGEISCNLGAVC